MQSPLYNERGRKRESGGHSTIANKRGVQQTQQQYNLRGRSESDKIGGDHERAAAGTRSRADVLPSADEKSNAHVAFEIKKRVPTPTGIRDDDYDDAAVDERHLGNPRRRRLSESKNDTNIAGLG